MSRPVKYTIEDLKLFATNKNSKCLDVVYINSGTRYTWICEKNHEFKLAWYEALRGTWCKKCSFIERSNCLENLREKAKHNNGQCLSLVYTNKDSKYEWKCSEGHTWFAKWGEIKRGKWCKTCSGVEKIPDNIIDQFLDSLSNLKVIELIKNGNQSYIKFECQNQHVTETTYKALKKYPYCKYCKKKYRTLEDIQKIAKESNIEVLSKEYINTKTKLDFKCSKGHIFSKTPPQFEKKPKCLTCEGYYFNDFNYVKNYIEKEGYDLISCNYEYNERLKTVCPEGHEYNVYFRNFKNNNTRCPECLNRTSKGEKSVLQFVQKYYKSACKIKIKDIFGDTELNNSEFDIYIPELKVAIEYNGVFFHSDALNPDHRRTKTSQYRKYEFCKNNNIRLINIFEDEWLYRQEQTKNFLLSVLNIHDSRVGASKCKIKAITKNEAIEFINKNHIQEVYTLKIAYGLFYKNELVGVVTGSAHHRINNHKYLVLSRMCFKSGIQIIGGASRLLSSLKEYAIKYGYAGIVSWSDNRISTGDVYKKIGFELKKELSPDYFYVQSGVIKRINKSTLRVPAGIDERAYNRSKGYYQLWDCGKKTWILSFI
jgi:hypothetical protein